MTYGISLASAGFLRDALFGYIELYLNGATCPKCFERMGDAKEIPNFTICGACGEKVAPIKVTPIRLYLTIANDADLFDLFPDKIKANPHQLSLVSRFGPSVLSVYDQIDLDMMLEPLLAWFRIKRPDLYYTIAFYPLAPEWVQMLYDIEMNDMTPEAKKEICEEIGLEDCSQLYDVIISSLEKKVEERSEYYVMNGKSYVTKFDTKEEADRFVRENRDKYPQGEVVKMLGVSTRALKTFSRQVESLKNNMRLVLEEWVGNS
ncbi:MAG: hypothetical protein PHZ19_07870 [Candidatus Thermoplasmatota archaeon]|nr:hypothetical protein [Candidatus Thermoplasmatota archaeon]